MLTTRSDIADLVEKEARDLFANGWVPRDATVAKFRAIGKSREYDVAAHGGDASHGEWLYDLCWFENRDGFFIRQSLVLETEQSPDRCIDADFHKLVQARAEVRVWIAKVHHSKVAQHVAVHKEQIRRFAGTSPDDVYVFVICDGGNAAFIERFAVSDITP